MTFAIFTLFIATWIILAALIWATTTNQKAIIKLYDHLIKDMEKTLRKNSKEGN